MTHHLSKFRAVPYVYRWTKELEHLLPEHYRKRCMEFMTGTPTPVHWRPDPREFELDKYGTRLPVQSFPIKVLFPKECNNGLWGGEGIVRGYRKRGPHKPRIPKYWRPLLRKQVFYSEILDRHMVITVTNRTVLLIDEACGFDHYILKTPEIDLNSRLGMALKREMLLALISQSFHKDDPAKQNKVYERYKQYIIPEEEAEWLGLDIGAAIRKGQDLEAKKNAPRPLKEVYEAELLEKIRMADLESSGSTFGFLQKINPFAAKSESEKKN